MGQQRDNIQAFWDNIAAFWDDTTRIFYRAGGWDNTKTLMSSQNRLMSSHFVEYVFNKINRLTLSGTTGTTGTTCFVYIYEKIEI